MPSYFSVIQYVPDPIADERVNVGVVVFGDGIIRSRFVHNWRRAGMLGGETPQFLREFARAVQRWSPPQAQLPGIQDLVRVTEGELRGFAGRWINAVQITPPRASLGSPDEVIAQISERFLKEARARRRGFRDRRVAANLAFVGLRSALQELGAVDTHAVSRNVMVRGALDEHRFDVALTHGIARVLAQGLSFEGPPTRDLEREVDAAAWALDDLRSAAGGASTAVVALPPRTHSKTYDRARDVFRGLSAEVVEEPEVHDWAMGVTRKLVGVDP